MFKLVAGVLLVSLLATAASAGFLSSAPLAVRSAGSPGGDFIRCTIYLTDASKVVTDVRVWALDESGNRRGEVGPLTLEPTPGGFDITTSYRNCCSSGDQHGLMCQFEFKGPKRAVRASACITTTFDGSCTAAVEAF
jgi:hypothetical protein